MSELSFDYIDKNCIWVVKFDSGYRRTGNYDEISRYKDDDDIDEIDTVSWRGQPKELQQFFKDYEYTLYRLRRMDLYLMKDFYAEWIKDPKQFEPQIRPVIGKLSEVIKQFDECSSVIINNYDQETAGNHHVGNFIEALEDNNINFDVVEVNTSETYPRIVVQTDDIDTFDLFGTEANSNAIRHDRFMGDGKYWEEEKDMDI